MDRKCIHSQIESVKDILIIKIQKSDMYLSYLLLDQLLNDCLEEISFYDGKTAQKIYVRRSNDVNHIIVDDDFVYMTNDCIEYLKQMIVQCHMRPYDAEWLHYDIEAYNTHGDDVAMCIHL